MHDIFDVHKMNAFDVHILNSVEKKNDSQDIVPVFAFKAGMPHV